MRNEQQDNMLVDPFSATSGTVIYEKAHLVNIIISDKPGITEKLPQQEQIIIKMAISQEGDNIDLLCLQFSSDKELEFNFQFRCNDIEFRRIRELQKFFIQFREYPEVIMKNFDKLANKISPQQPHMYEANFIIFSETLGKLQVIRKSEFKDDQIMEFECKRSPEEHIQASVQYRYDLMRKEYKSRIHRYEEYREIIRAKNPSLMMQIDKALKLRK